MGGAEMKAIEYGLLYIKKHNIPTSYAERHDFILEHGGDINRLLDLGKISKELHIKT